MTTEWYIDIARNSGGSFVAEVKLTGMDTPLHTTGIHKTADRAHDEALSWVATRVRLPRGHVFPTPKSNMTDVGEPSKPAETDPTIAYEKLAIRTESNDWKSK